MRRRRRRNFSHIMHFKRSAFAETLTITTAGGNEAAAYAISIGNMPNVTEFSSLFDAYRINKVVFKFIPSYNTYYTGTTLAAGTSLPKILTALDFDDATAPTAADELFQYDTLRIHTGDKRFSRKFTPFCAPDIGASNSSGVKSKQWIDWAFTNIPHYGLKIFMEGNAATAIQYSLNVYRTIYFSCRGIR